MSSRSAATVFLLRLKWSVAIVDRVLSNPFSGGDATASELSEDSVELCTKLMAAVNTGEDTLTVIYGEPGSWGGRLGSTLAAMAEPDWNTLQLDAAGSDHHTVSDGVTDSRYVAAYSRSLASGQTLLATLNRKLKSAREPLLVAVRGAQALTNLHLATLMRLMVRQQQAGRRVACILIGSPEFAERVRVIQDQADGTPSCSWRIISWQADCRKRVARFVARRSGEAGDEDLTFTEDALARIVSWTECDAPRIRTLCGWSYLLWLRDASGPLGSDLVDEAARRCGLAGDAGQGCTPFPEGEEAVAFLQREHPAHRTFAPVEALTPAPRRATDAAAAGQTALRSVGPHSSDTTDRATETGPAAPLAVEEHVGAGPVRTEPRTLPDLVGGGAAHGGPPPESDDRVPGVRARGNSEPHVTEPEPVATQARSAARGPGGWIAMCRAGADRAVHDVHLKQLLLRARGISGRRAGAIGLSVVGIGLVWVLLGDGVETTPSDTVAETPGARARVGDVPVRPRATGRTDTAPPKTAGPGAGGSELPAVAALVQLADHQFASRKLTTPEGDNALQTYLTVLRLEPGNAQAMAGLARMAEQYRQWADTVSARNQAQKSELYLKRADEVEAHYRRFVMNADNVLSWAGCGVTKKAFMAELAAAFQHETGIRVVLEGGGATRGIRDTAGSVVHMGGACRMALPLEDPSELHVTLHPVAWDALTVVVHPSNPIRNISSEEIRRIYLGRITNWSELGGADTPIHLCVRHGKISGVGYAIRQYLFRNRNVEFVTDPAYIFPSSGPLEKTVEVDPLAIGITGISSARKRAVAVVGIDGDRPTFENMVSGRYNFYRPLYLVTRQRPEGNVRAFVDFAMSTQGQEVIRNNGTVPYLDAPDLASRTLVHGFGVQ